MKAGAILLGDRSFASYFGIAELLHRQIDGVFRMHQRRKIDFRRGRCLGVTDHLVIVAEATASRMDGRSDLRAGARRDLGPRTAVSDRATLATVSTRLYW